jgi:hypothetical protein
MERIVGPMVYAMTEKHWPLGHYALHDMGLVLDELNVFGGWDRRESITRTPIGVEQILMEIEPSLVFARLHGSWLKHIDPDLLDQFNLRIYADKDGEYLSLDTPWIHSIKDIFDMSS